MKILQAYDMMQHLFSSIVKNQTSCVIFFSLSMDFLLRRSGPMRGIISQ
ncbi:MAG: hypothetical protein ETSY2_36335 [Candidatus Entotheonella gemina]|uniref:Uncharacterized protein n=1 Tax=Candidatus Entotheonella gemina TaxID=1429439 RepID=W4LVR5_9BACT|nr:MAG: hypothetical protein ETSY2_36335 [Candidatus Entotheonella gemina]